MYAQFLINLLTFLCLVSFEDQKQFMVNGRPTVINAGRDRTADSRGEYDRKQVGVTPLAADSDQDSVSQSAPVTKHQCKENTDNCLVGFEQKLLSYQDPQTTLQEKIRMVMPMCQKYFETLQCLHYQMLVCPVSTHNLIRQKIEYRIGNLREFMMRTCANPPTHPPTTTTTTTTTPRPSPTSSAGPAASLTSRKPSSALMFDKHFGSGFPKQKLNNQIKHTTTPASTRDTHRNFAKLPEDLHIPNHMGAQPTPVVVLDLPEDTKLVQDGSWTDGKDAAFQEQSHTECNSIQCALGLTSSTHRPDMSVVILLASIIFAFLSIH